MYENAPILAQKMEYHILSFLILLIVYCSFPAFRLGISRSSSSSSFNSFGDAVMEHSGAHEDSDTGMVRYNSEEITIIIC